ncbi:MAG TPA: carboxymuconolactone decarboxylase family protein [Nitrososphaeraceae archaeon]|nr:carboxymuconolactone decarboxylase family protein [Nitrososphaeraceae archaeon]
MKNEQNSISDAFQTFLRDAPEYSQAWMKAIDELDKANVLDDKTKSLAYLSVLAALELTSGIPFHVQHAKSLDVTRNEVIGAILVGMPAAGNKVVQALHVALHTYDS